MGWKLVGWVIAVHEGMGHPPPAPRPRSYGDQGGLTMKLTSSVQSTVVSQGFVPSPSLAI